VPPPGDVGSPGQRRVEDDDVAAHASGQHVAIDLGINAPNALDGHRCRCLRC
jgi:hypothetical protein